jgi:hypothetical protein
MGWSYQTPIWGSTVVTSMDELYTRLIMFLPALVVAILILIFGWAVAILLGRITSKFLHLVKIDELFGHLGMTHLEQRAGRKLSVAAFGEWLVKWFFLLVAFLAASDLLGLVAIEQFLFNQVVPFFGNVVIASAVLIIGVIVGNFLHGIIKHSMQAGRLSASSAIASLARWAVLVFAFLAALSQLGVASEFVHDLFRGTVLMLAIAFGLAFGLGGRDHAKEFLDYLARGSKK